MCSLVERLGISKLRSVLILLIFWQYNLEMSFSLSQTHVQDILSKTTSVGIYSPIQNMSVLRDWRYVHDQWICPCIHTSVLNRGWINLLNKIPEHWNIYILEKQRLSAGIELMQYFRTEGMFIRVQLVFYLAIVEKERVSLILGVLQRRLNYAWDPKGRETDWCDCPKEYIWWKLWLYPILRAFILWSCSDILPSSQTLVGEHSSKVQRLQSPIMNASKNIETYTFRILCLSLSPLF